MKPRTATGAELVGPYEIVKAIGAGGSARVDLARLHRAYGFERHVVIKRPLEHLRADARVAASIRREARLGTKLRHPNLVTILDAGEHDGYDYLVLEYIHGGSLRSLIEAEEPTRIRDVPLGVALSIVGDVARGLHQAHELVDDHAAPLGLVHRDVSPGNVLIGADGTVKLADFGIAKETRVQTLSGSMHGTVTYMAPEQCRGHAFDRRADVFSLGVILYELVTGTRLFWADNDVASLHRVLSGQVVRPRKVRPSIPSSIEELVMSAIAHDPERRLASAGALAKAVEDHAVSSGELLAARRIAHWVHELIGPREAPWVGDETVVDLVPVAPPVPEVALAASLVELIQATPDDEPHAMAFGPTDEAEHDIDTEPRRPPAIVQQSRRRWLGIALGISLGAASTAVVAWLALRGDDRPEQGDAPVAAPIAVPPDAPPAPVVGDEPPGTDEPVVVDESIELEPVDEGGTPGTPARPKKSRRGKREPAAGSASPPPVIGTGSGSAQIAKPPRGKVEWAPDILLPTDKAGAGSGTNKR